MKVVPLLLTLVVLGAALESSMPTMNKNDAQKVQANEQKPSQQTQQPDLNTILHYVQNRENEVSFTNYNDKLKSVVDAKSFFTNLDQEHKPASSSPVAEKTFKQEEQDIQQLIEVSSSPPIASLFSDGQSKKKVATPKQESLIQQKPLQNNDQTELSQEDKEIVTVLKQQPKLQSINEKQQPTKITLQTDSQQPMTPEMKEMTPLLTSGDYQMLHKPQENQQEQIINQEYQHSEKKPINKQEEIAFLRHHQTIYNWLIQPIAIALRATALEFQQAIDFAFKQNADVQENSKKYIFWILLVAIPLLILSFLASLSYIVVQIYLKYQSKSQTPLTEDLEQVGSEKTNLISKKGFRSMSYTSARENLSIFGFFFRILHMGYYKSIKK